MRALESPNTMASDRSRPRFLSREATTPLSQWAACLCMNEGTVSKRLVSVKTLQDIGTDLEDPGVFLHD